MLKGAVRGVILVGVTWIAACASNPARSSNAVPLEIPEPPPRVAMDPVPAVAEAAPPEAPETTLPATPVVAAPPSPRTPVAATPPPPANPPVAQAPEPARPPPPELRPAGPAGKSLTVTQVRERIVRTKQKLDSIDRRLLSTGKRTDYDTARRFLDQANEAAKLNNLMLAESSVDKAETLADGLR